jgi:hypothetical protein
MDAVSPLYAALYLVFAATAISAILWQFFSRSTLDERNRAVLLIVPLFAAYMVGMYRMAGEDYDNYAGAYYGSAAYPDIPDQGYVAITALTKSLGLSFNAFLVLSGFFTLTVLWKVAKKYDADPTTVVVIYLCHLAVGRDLSQIRIGLAVSIYLLGHLQAAQWRRWLLFVVAASFHITVLVLVAVWACADSAMRLSPRKRPWIAYLPMAGFAVLGSGILQLASLVDPRVDIYLAWNEDSFGAPLGSYAALTRSITVIAVYVLAMRRFRDLPLQRFMLMEFAGAAVLLAFSDYAIFASRLSNVAISMYPIGLGIVARAYQRRPVRSGTRGVSVMLKLGLILTFLILIVRPATFETLAKVGPAIPDFLDQ